MRPGIIWLVLLLVVAPGGVVGADPAEEAARAAAEVERQVAEVKEIDARTAEGEARLLELALDPTALPPLRAAAVATLARGAVSSPEVQQGVLSLVSKEVEETVRMAAINSLRQVGVPADQAIPQLITVLDDIRIVREGLGQADRPCDRAVMVLIGYGPNYGPEARAAVPALRWGIHPKNSQRLQSEYAEVALGMIAPEEFPHFAMGDAAVVQSTKLLAFGAPGEQRYAALRLTDMYWRYGLQGQDVSELFAPTIPALEENLDHPDRDVRLATAGALLIQQPHEGGAAVFDAAIDLGDEFDRAWIFSWLTGYPLHFDGTRLFYDKLHEEDLRDRIRAARLLASHPEYEQEALGVVLKLYVNQQHSSDWLSALRAFRPELIEPMRPILETLAKEKNTKGYRARKMLEQRFGVVVEPEKKPAADTGR